MHALHFFGVKKILKKDDMKIYLVSLFLLTFLKTLYYETANSKQQTANSKS